MVSSATEAGRSSDQKGPPVMAGLSIECSASDGIGLLRGLLGLARLLGLVLLLILRLFPLLVLLLVGILIVGVVHAGYSAVDARQDWLAQVNKRRGQ
jgi:hypothetical protein